MRFTVFLVLVALSMAQRPTLTDVLRTTTEQSVAQTTTEEITTTEKPLDPCDKTHCSDQCDVQNGKAVCSCTDDRFALDDDEHTCVPRTCESYWTRNGNNYQCGSGAKCQTQWNPTFKRNLPTCYCSTRTDTYNKDDKSCSKNPNFKTCDWPVKYSCDQKCEAKFINGGSEPVCTCPQSGYSLDKDGKSCIVTNQCLVGGNNGGCDQQCKHLAPGKVDCSCNNLFTLHSDGKKCLAKNCANGNSGCSHGCSQFTETDFVCYCPRGLRLDTDQKTCYDYDECQGFHGCDTRCVPDGTFYKCVCDQGFVLDSDGFTCNQADLCATSGCEQRCNPHDGQCYCDDHHIIDPQDPRKCVDRDECSDRSAKCSELCENTPGGYTCKCFNPKAKLSNDLRTCYLDTCDDLANITHGVTTCTKGNKAAQHMEVNDYCEFKCNPGYALDGKRMVRCLETGYDYVPPACIDMDECMNNPCGQDEVCANSIGSFKCLCKTGYKRVGDKCVDRTPPNMQNCPSDKTVTVANDASTATVTWSRPQFRDAAGMVNLVKNPDVSQTLRIGDHTIEYVATDMSGNPTVCSFKVRVQDSTRPKIEGCIDRKTYFLSPGEYTLSSIVNVSASDNSGEVRLTNDLPVSTFTRVGIYQVNFHAMDSSGNQAFCSVTVNISAIDCKPLQPPVNGFHGCDDWHIGTFCEPRCKPGFKFYEKPVERYHCGDIGQWTPAEDIPPCVPESQATAVHMTFTSTYFASCPDDTTELIKFASSYFTNYKSAFCKDLVNCQLNGSPTIDCTAGDQLSLTLTTNEDFASRLDLETLKSEFIQAIKAVKSKNPAFMSLFFGNFQIKAPVPDSHGIPTTPALLLTCPSGTTQIDAQCVSCPSGTC